MLVLIIMVILATISSRMLFGSLPKAKNRTAYIEIRTTLKSALEEYYLDTGDYPTTEEGLVALVRKPSESQHSDKWLGPYLEDLRHPIDPWERKYMYQYPGQHNTHKYDLYSLGKDGVESDDDIVNWLEEGSLLDS